MEVLTEEASELMTQVTGVFWTQLLEQVKCVNINLTNTYQFRSNWFTRSHILDDLEAILS